jgi:hypothetical protein
MELLGDVGHVESHFGPFGDSVSVGARSVQSLRQTYHGFKSHFGHTLWNSQVTWVMWNLISILLETLVVSVQDMCMVCAKRTTGSEVILAALDGTPM